MVLYQFSAFSEIEFCKMCQSISIVSCMHYSCLLERTQRSEFARAVAAQRKEMMNLMAISEMKITGFG